MMNELKKKSVLGNLGLIIVFVAIGIGMLFYSVPSVIKLIQKPVPLEEVDFSGDIDGLYVRGTLYRIYDWYCETKEGVDTVSREYIIDTGDLHYMGMRVMAKDMSPAEKLRRAYLECLEERDDGTALEAAQYEVTGTITKMPKDSHEMYWDYLGGDYMTAEEQEQFLSYYLDVNKVGKNDPIGAIILAVLGCIFIFVGLFFVLWSMLGKYQKSVNQYINNSGNPDMAKERVESFIKNTPEYKKLRYNNDFICGESSGNIAFGETAKLVWAYRHTTTYKRYFITVRKTHALMLVFTDGIRQVAAVKSEADALEHLEKLASLCPQAIIGYDDELDRQCSTDFAGFMNLKYNNSENTMQ